MSAPPPPDHLEIFIYLFILYLFISDCFLNLPVYQFFPLVKFLPSSILSSFFIFLLSPLLLLLRSSLLPFFWPLPLAHCVLHRISFFLSSSILSSFSVFSFLSLSFIRSFPPSFLLPFSPRFFFLSFSLSVSHLLPFIRSLDLLLRIFKFFFLNPFSFFCFFLPHFPASILLRFFPSSFLSSPLFPPSLLPYLLPSFISLTHSHFLFFCTSLITNVTH